MCNSWGLDPALFKPVDTLDVAERVPELMLYTKDSFVQAAGAPALLHQVEPHSAGRVEARLENRRSPRQSKRSPWRWRSATVDGKLSCVVYVDNLVH